MRIRSLAVCVALVLMFNFCSCKKDKITYTFSSFSQMVTITSAKGNFSGTLTCENKDRITFEVIEPEEINGVCYSREYGKESVIFASVEIFPKHTDSCIFDLLDIISHFYGKSFNVSAQGQTVITEEKGTKKYELVFDNSKLHRIQADEYTLEFK